MSSPVSRGFRRLRRPSPGKEGRVPPGQYVTQGDRRPAAAGVRNGYDRRRSNLRDMLRGRAGR